MMHLQRVFWWVAVWRHYCRSTTAVPFFFFYAAGAPFKAPTSFNFSLKFSKWRLAVKKKRIAK
jgi:hypothetical protein